MEEKRVKELALQAAKIRRTALEAINAAQSGHVGGSFSVADILTVLYFEKMNIARRIQKIRIGTGLYCPKDTVPPPCTPHWR